MKTSEEKLPILELEEEIIYALDNMTTRENQITFLIHTAKIYHLQLERDRLAEERVAFYNKHEEELNKLKQTK